MFKIVPSEVYRSFKGESRGTAQDMRGIKKGRKEVHDEYMK
jgi:hypothetical protein